MPLEFRHGLFVMRVDGDILEIFTRGSFSERLPLAWLAVQVQPSIKGSLVMRITSAYDDLPLYEMTQKTRNTRGRALETVIKTAEEPLYRQFFAQVAELCGRPVVS
jgi:hypothetical protein